ncbi:MAG: histidinol-phosphate aminotransferase family protein [Methanospirillum sp.]|nr:histidinol-phosphate aminotransferase family protein [Methanospirillum sp.]
MERPIPERAVHGGLRQSEQGEHGWLDFSANLNPFPPRVSWAPDPSCLGHYPDDRYPALKEAAARTFGRPPDEITVGNGSVEVIRSFCMATLAPGDRVRIDGPTFGEYRFAAELAGASVTGVDGGAAVRFLCNPNNPTGTLLSRPGISEMLDATPSGTRLFVDEAFIELSDPSASMIGAEDDRVFVMRSMTKAFAVPGLRLGFGFGDPALVDRCERCRSPWSVNGFALSFALAALLEYPALEESRARIREERWRLEAGLVALGFEPLPAAANFVCARSPVPVGALFDRLARQRIRVRDCASFGLPGFVRIAVRTRDENRRLLEVLETCSA